jgi:hypothetical protein
MSARLASSVLVSALIRKAEAEGGFGAVLARGDATAGSVLVILTERGANARLFERILQPDGHYAWRPATRDSAEVPAFVARRRRFDPDSWVLELDIPALERFAAGMNAFD